MSKGVCPRPAVSCGQHPSQVNPGPRLVVPSHARREAPALRVRSPQQSRIYIWQGYNPCAHQRTTARQHLVKQWPLGDTARPRPMPSILLTLYHARRSKRPVMPRRDSESHARSLQSKCRLAAAALLPVIDYSYVKTLPSLCEHKILSHWPLRVDLPTLPTSASRHGARIGLPKFHAWWPGAPTKRRTVIWPFLKRRLLDAWHPDVGAHKAASPDGSAESHPPSAHAAIAEACPAQ